MALATLTGFLVDRFGRNMVFMIAAIFTGLTAHILAAARCSPYLIIVSLASHYLFHLKCSEEDAGKHFSLNTES